MTAMTSTYQKRLSQLETYFDRTASDAWAKLTSDAPVSKIRATVRAGRDETRNTLLNWLPTDLRGKRILDAGCGTGMLAVEAARRGAHVTAVDISPSLIEIANQRMPKDLGDGSIVFSVGDMMNADLGRFDHMVAMDSLIHYSAADVAKALGTVSERIEGSILFTFAPRTPLLTVMGGVGKLFPRSDRSPAIVPVGQDAIRKRLVRSLAKWQPARTHRVKTGFYISQSLELTRR